MRVGILFFKVKITSAYSFWAQQMLQHNGAAAAAYGAYY